MGTWTKRLSLLIGAASLGIGIGGLVQPKLLAKLLSLDSTQRAGRFFVAYVGVRDIISALLIWRGRNSAGAMRQAMIVRLFFEITDVLLLVFGRGFVQQPRARLMAALVPPLIVTEALLVRDLSKRQDLSTAKGAKGR